MNCPQCGEVCRCQSEPLPASLLQSSPGTESEKSSAVRAALEMKWNDPEGAGIASEEASDSNIPPDVVAPSDSSEEPGDVDAEAWRDELSARLNRYRSRRKVRPPRYPSLSLRFEPFESAPRINASS